jgi:hypothetical protein
MEALIHPTIYSAKQARASPLVNDAETHRDMGV